MQIRPFKFINFWLTGSIALFSVNSLGSVISCENQTVAGKTFEFHDMDDDGALNTDSLTFHLETAAIAFGQPQGDGVPSEVSVYEGYSGADVTDLVANLKLNDRSKRCELHVTGKADGQVYSEFFEVLGQMDGANTLWLGEPNTVGSEIFFELNLNEG